MENFRSSKNFPIVRTFSGKFPYDQTVKKLTQETGNNFKMIQKLADRFAEMKQRLDEEVASLRTSLSENKTSSKGNTKALNSYLIFVILGMQPHF